MTRAYYPFRVLVGKEVYQSATIEGARRLALSLANAGGGDVTIRWKDEKGRRTEETVTPTRETPAVEVDMNDDDAPNLLAQDLPLLLAAARAGKLTQPQGVALVVNVDRLLRRVNGLTDELMRPKTPRRRR
jgi:hypothetical protein